ncbi:LysR family substrate-binding domain-containing protein, partial [Mycolicibacterium sp.]
LRRDRLLIALPADHVLAGRDVVPVGELRDVDFISHAGRGRSRMSALITEMCLAEGFSPRIRHEVEETSTLVTMVAAGLGVAVVPEPTAALGVRGVVYRPVSTRRAAIDLLVAVRNGDTSPLIANALAIVRANAGGTDLATANSTG